MQILIVCNDEKNIEELKTMLKKQEEINIDIWTCASFGESLEIIRYRKIDLFLMTAEINGIFGIKYMRQIKKMIPESQVVFFSPKRNFDFLVEAINNGANGFLIQPFQKKDIADILNKAAKQIRKKYISSLNKISLEEYDKYQMVKYIIQEKVTDDSDISEFLSIGCKLKSLQVLVGAVVQDDKVDYRLDTKDEIRVVVREKIEEYLIGYDYFPFLMSGDEAFILINVPNSTLRIHHLYYQMKKMTEAINNEIVDGSMSVGVSNIGNSHDIPRIYRQAEMALEYRYCYGSGSYLEYKSCKEIEDKKMRFSEKIWNQKILDAVQYGEEKGLRSIILQCQNMLLGVKKEKVLEFIMKNIILVDRIYMEDKGGEKIKCSLLKLSYFNETILLWEDFLLHALKEKSIGKNYSLAINKAIKYIDEHYMEKLNVEKVADCVGVSEGHFSRIFKQQTGKTFTKYLNEIRIDNAEKLICNSTYKLYEIAELVGIQDYAYFTQIFKKNKNISPSDLRKLKDVDKYHNN